MDIRLIEKAGVPKSEIEAHQRIEKAFNSSEFSKGWRGYASFKLNRGGPGAGDDDFDFILVTHTHIVVVELKNWRGKKLESRGGSWFVDGEPRGRSPVPLVSLKAKRLASALQTRVGLTKTPFIYSFVVLSESLSELDLDASEANSVLYLNDLLSLASERDYKRVLARSTRINPLSYLSAYDLFFVGQRGRPAGFTIHGFKPENQPLWVHPNKLYSEFRAKEKVDPDKLALFRQWDFSVLGTALIGEGDRGFIGLREQRVYEHVEPRNEELSRSLLRPITRRSEADVTSDFSELYVLPPKITRLSEFVNATLLKLTPTERIVLVKALLQRFADLHDLNVAHRDIGAHCVWVERPAKVIISGFSAAYYPSTQTVGTFRNKVKVERSNLPEDIGLSKEVTPYHRDVYALGVLSHLILFGERPPKVSDVFTWERRATDPYDGRFDEILTRALSVQPQERYENARHMLDAINSASSNESVQLLELSLFDAHKAKSRARDYPEEESPLKDDDDLLSYVSSVDGQRVLVKEWHGVEPDLKKPDLAIRLLSFLERARNLRAAGLKGLPEIRDYGLSRRSLLVVLNWVDGVTLTEWMKSDRDLSSKLEVAQSLVRSLSRMHDFEWPHGDLKPDNIVIRPDGQPVLVDVLDFRRAGEEVYSTAYLPPDYKGLSPLARDRYAIAAVIKEFLVDSCSTSERIGLSHVCEEVQRLIDDRTVSALEPLQAALDGKSHAASAVDPEPYRVSVRSLATTGIQPGDMVSDNGYFYLTQENSRKTPGAKLMHLTGAGARLSLEWDSSKGQCTWVAVKRIDLTQLIWAQDRCLGRIAVRISLVDGPRGEASELEPSLAQWATEFSNETVGKSDDVSIPPDIPEERDPLVVTHAQLRDESIASYRESENSEKVSVPKATAIDVKELWEGLLSAEEDALPIATVTGEAMRSSQRSHQILVPCVIEGRGFDPDADDHTWVERRAADGFWRRCGELELRDTSLGRNAELAIERWNAKPLQPGDKLRLRSNMESASLNRRANAVERIVDGRAVISNLMDYLQTDAEQPLPMVFDGPEDSSLEAYSQGAKKLNTSQRVAFQKALQHGPISLLQGPPGTGKTWFIASLLHYLVTKEGARRVLVVSQAHEAVNNALEKALELFEAKGIAFDAVRLGHESVVSEPIRHLHSASIEQVYRESFKAEYKDRVVRLAAEMGLKPEFSAAAVKLHLGVGRLIEQISLLELEALGQVPTSDSKEPDELLEAGTHRIRQLTETVRDICQRDYQFEVGDIPLGEALEHLFDSLAKQHEVQSPQALERLRKLLKLSDDWLKTLGEPAANFIEFLAKSRTVVAGTLVGIGRRAAGVIQNMYDWVIIDEAGRAAPSEVAVAMQTGRRILLVGDHKQLPPTFDQEVRDAVSKNLGYGRESPAFVSDFERLFDSKYGKSVGASLTEQYRMAPAIGELVSDVFYQKDLHTGRPASWLDTSLLPAKLKHEVSWVDTSTLGKAAFENSSPDRIDCWNETEAQVVMGVLKALIQRNGLIKALHEGLQSGDPIIGVICMYSKQREIINRLKNEARWIPQEIRRLIKVDTVDSYQGKENRIIILSTVRNNPNMQPGFLRSPNRINVAMSRAMERLIIVGATPMWRGRNEGLPLGQVLKKVESLAEAGRSEVVRAQEFKV